MAILNVTPDSFSDGGRFRDAAEAVEEGLRLFDRGAAILDVGGESTRPRGSAYGEGAADVAVNEELSRVVPVVDGLRRERPFVAISVDTRRAEVAEAALEAGADVVNVVTGLAPEPALLSVIARRGAVLVLNHCRGTPHTTFAVSRFTHVVREVTEDLRAARERAVDAGVPRGAVLLDPGLGFGKRPAESFALLGALDELAALGSPIVVGASRKAFLGSLREPPPPARERLPESLAAVAIAADLARRHPVVVRVHDADETLRFLAVLSETGKTAGEAARHT